MIPGPGARASSVFLAALLLGTTLGEGGATPTATLLVHGAVALLVLLVLLGTGGGRRIARPPAAAFALFAVLAVAGAAVAPYAFAAWLVLLEIAVLAGVLGLGASAGPGSLRLLATILTTGAVLHGGAAAVERLAGAPRPASTFLNPNHLAAWLVAALLLAAPFAIGRGRRGAAIFSVAALLPLAGIALSGSRGALLGLVAGGAALFVLRRKELPPRGRRLFGIVVVFLVLVAGAGVAGRMAGADPYRWTRIRIWRASLGEALEHPWLGAGPGQFPVAAANRNFPLEAERLRYGRSFRTPHSDLLRLPVEFGLPATLAVGAALLLAAGVVRGARRRGELPEEADGALGALAALGAQALFDDLTARPALLLLAGALAGALLSRPAPGDGPAPRQRSLRGAAAFGIVLAFVVGEGAPFLAWRAMHDLPRGRLDSAGEARLEAALARNPAHPDAWRRLAEHLVGDGTRWDAETYARAREAVERAIDLQPADALYRRAAAWVEGMACRTLFRDVATRERAASRYEEAERLSRYDATIPLDAGRFLLGTGDPAGARRAAERALRIEPRAAVPRALLAETILAAGTPNAAARALALLDEAERLAILPADVNSPYEARLLVLDREGVAMLRSRIDEALRAEGAR